MRQLGVGVFQGHGDALDFLPCEGTAECHTQGGFGDLRFQPHGKQCAGNLVTANGAGGSGRGGYASGVQIDKQSFAGDSGENE